MDHFLTKGGTSPDWYTYRGNKTPSSSDGPSQNRLQPLNMSTAPFWFASQSNQKGGLSKMTHTPAPQISAFAPPAWSPNSDADQASLECVGNQFCSLSCGCSAAICQRINGWVESDAKEANYMDKNGLGSLAKLVLGPEISIMTALLPSNIATLTDFSPCSKPQSAVNKESLQFKG